MRFPSWFSFALKSLPTISLVFLCAIGSVTNLPVCLLTAIILVSILSFVDIILSWFNDEDMAERGCRLVSIICFYGMFLTLTFCAYEQSLSREKGSKRMPAWVLSVQHVFQNCKYRHEDDIRGRGMDTAWQCRELFSFRLWGQAPWNPKNCEK